MTVRQTTSTDIPHSGYTVPDSISAAVTELLIRYELGHFEPRIRARLTQIFRENPLDALERIERAAAYIGVDGQELDMWAAQADALTINSRRQEA